MDEIVRNLNSPAWWASVVVAGIVVNIVAAYLKPAIDSVAGRVSAEYRARNEAQLRKRQELIQHLKAAPHDEILYALSEARSRMRSAAYLLLAIFVFQVTPVVFLLPERLKWTGWIFWAVSAVFFLIAVNCVREALRREAVLLEIEASR